MSSIECYLRYYQYPIILSSTIWQLKFFGQKFKKIKNFDGLVKTILMIPHNPGFGQILMTLLGGRRDPSEGSWGGRWGQKMKKKIKKNYEGLRRFRWYPINPGFCSIIAMTLLGGRQDPLEGSLRWWWGRKFKKNQISNFFLMPLLAFVSVSNM